VGDGPVVSRFLESTDSLQQIDGPEEASKIAPPPSQLARAALLVALKRIEVQSRPSEPRDKQDDEEEDEGEWEDVGEEEEEQAENSG
jgi:hypothetical protein